MTRAIKASENNGGIRIRLTIAAKKFNITLQKLRWDTPSDRAMADVIAARVTADVVNRCFDETLKRYQIATATPKQTGLTELKLWDAWVESLRLPSYTQAGHYSTTRRALERGDLFSPSLSAFTHNLRRRQLGQCYQWGIELGLTTQSNPYANVKSKRAKHQTIKVFSRSELRSILVAFKDYWSDYSDFIEALMISGCRFGECAGIQRNAIDLERQTVTIKASVRRNIETNQIELRQGTKTESVRELESPQLIAVLQRHGLPDEPSELVFKNRRGTFIRRNSFTQSVWRPALEKAGVEHRRIHVLRHTCLSMALASGCVSVPDVAYIAGHRDSTMVVRTYGHILKRPQLPSMDL